MDVLDKAKVAIESSEDLLLEEYDPINEQGF
jgi:hypothetical protein